MLYKELENGCPELRKVIEVAIIGQESAVNCHAGDGDDCYDGIRTELTPTITPQTVKFLLHFNDIYMFSAGWASTVFS